MRRGIHRFSSAHRELHTTCIFTSRAYIGCISCQGRPPFAHITHIFQTRAFATSIFGSAHNFAQKNLRDTESVKNRNRTVLFGNSDLLKRFLVTSSSLEDSLDRRVHLESTSAVDVISNRRTFHSGKGSGAKYRSIPSAPYLSGKIIAVLYFPSVPKAVRLFKYKLEIERD